MATKELLRTAAAAMPSQAGLSLLVRAFHYAASTRTDPWYFAIDLPTLTGAGLTMTDLRWLLAARHAQHADEITHATDAERRFGPKQLATITPQSCFVLTPEGARALEPLVKGAPSGPGTETFPTENNSITESRRPVALRSLSDRAGKNAKPVWDGDNRTLCLDGKLIKQFKVPAHNQVLLLAAFQEQDWPHGIDDPLPPVASIDPKDRLKAAIRCLNRNQRCPLVRFRGNGNGMRIYWERVE